MVLHPPSCVIENTLQAIHLVKSQDPFADVHEVQCHVHVHCTSTQGKSSAVTGCCTHHVHVHVGELFLCACVCMYVRARARVCVPILCIMPCLLICSVGFASIVRSQSRSAEPGLLVLVVVVP